MMIRAAAERDLPAIAALLESFDLTTAGVAESMSGFLVAEEAGQVIALAGLEVYGTGALLRSVAVRADHRKSGLAKTLVTHLLDRARHAGVREVYLLTTTAKPYFERLGFDPVSRAAVDPAVTRSPEFGDRLCATAVAMRLILTDGGRG